MITIFRAPWVLPIAQPPIRAGWVAVDGDRILGVGQGHAHPDGSVQDVDGAILPALVNAHIHLELSWMRGQVPPAPSMPQWVARLMALRRTVGHEPPEPIQDALLEVRACGTALVGDITNTFAAYEPLIDSELSAAVFRELLGFTVTDPASVLEAVRARIDDLVPIEWLRTTIVPHAPYSVSPQLMEAIARASAGRPLSIHLAESAEELEFLEAGRGPWRELLTSLGIWNESWQAPGCGPLEYIARHGLLSDTLIAVHGVHLTDGELARLAAAKATVVTCPRSNRWVGAGLPSVARFYASGVRVAVGTDSLASVEDLNLWSELALMRELAPEVPASEILTSATMHGAHALGFGAELGTLERGKRAALIAVQTPADLRDVEEYLCSGIVPRQVQWLHERHLEPGIQP